MQFSSVYIPCTKRLIRLLAVFILMLPNRVSAQDATERELVVVDVPPGFAYTVLDQMDGVEARYREGTGNDVTGVYSCAGFVARYYQEVYGITVKNLTDAGPPSPVDKLVRVSVPQKGDIIFWSSPPSRNNHSSIVKSFDGAKITLIEQNYKWISEGVTYAEVNRRIDYPSSDYEIYRAVYTQEALLPRPEERMPAAVELSEPALMVTLEYRALTDIMMDGGKPALTYSMEANTAFFQNAGQCRFTVPAEFDICVYRETWEEPPSYGLALSGETITAVSAMFRQPIETVAVFAETVPALSPSWQVVVTVGNPVMQVNGAEVVIDAPAYIENGRTMLPVKWLADAMGIDSGGISWDAADRTVTVSDGGRELQFTIGSNILSRNGAHVIMDAPAMIHHDRAYLPARYLADALEVTYEWNDETKTVTFKKDV